MTWSRAFSGTREEIEAKMDAEANDMPPAAKAALKGALGAMSGGHTSVSTHGSHGDTSLDFNLSISVTPEQEAKAPASRARSDRNPQ